MKKSIFTLALLMAFCLTGIGVFANETLENDTTPSTEVEQEETTETKHSNNSQKEDSKNEKEKTEVTKNDETQAEGESDNPQKENNSKSKIVKEELEAKKAERKEAKIESKDYIKSLKLLFKDADKETKKEILAEIAATKQELKDFSIGTFVKGLAVDFEKYDGVKPVIENGRTLVPIRAIIEAFDANVEWNGETSTITITKDETTIILQLNSKIALVNDVEVELEVAPTTVKDRTLVPFRFISETFKMNVEWDETSKTIVIE